MLKPAVTLEISTSTRPGFDLFATVTINGHQVSRCGDRDHIAAFTRELLEAGERMGVTVNIEDTSL